MNIRQRYHTDGTLADVVSGIANGETRWPDRQRHPTILDSPVAIMPQEFYKL
jgi:hypothetical protein